MSSRAYQYKVSVVIPIYNVETYISECLDSIADQTLDSLEVVLVDDGSQDGSSGIALAYAEKYPNFFYYLKENGGLGDARNYGMDRARGEYVCFCDSDDTIPSHAYDRMYELAKKYDSDIVSGDMIRFNSSKWFPSSLHRIAFANVWECMTIEDCPDLVYDSTVPNKLFRLKFLKDTNLRFPVGMYYEDIPFSLPAQCLANYVCHLDEVVYNWRARENGASITQGRTNWQNYADRLKALCMVDDFLRSHEVAPQVAFEKDVKALRVDLRLYVNVLPNADEEYRKAFMLETIPYLKGIQSEAFEYVDAVDRIKYYYILNNDLDGLLTYLEYAKGIMHALPVKEKHGKTYGRFGKGIPPEFCDMTEVLAKRGCAISVTQVDLNASDGLFVEGEVFYRILNAGKKDDIRVRAFLESYTKGKVVSELPAAIAMSQEPKVEQRHSIKHKRIRLLRREKTRYGFSLSYKELSNLPMGLYKVSLLYGRNQIPESRVFVAWPKRWSQAHSFPLAVGCKYVTISYNPGNQLVISVTKRPEHLVNRVSFSGVEFRGFSNEELVYKAKARGYGQDAMDGLAKTINKAELQTSIHGVHYHFLGTTTMRVKGMPEGILKVNALRAGAKSIQSYVDGTVFTFEIGGEGPTQLEGYCSARLIGRRYGVIIDCAQPIREEDGTLQVQVDVGEKPFVDRMRADTYNLCLTHSSEDEINHPPLLVYGPPRDSVETVAPKQQGYKYSLSMNGTEGISVSKVWKGIQNTAHRRRVLENKVYLNVYKVARYVVPLRRKTILFESYWGTQASCNPKGFYDYVQREHPEYRCVWSLADKRMMVEGDAVSVRKRSLAYYLEMACAHYFINNNNFEDWHEKRPDQIEIQTTHGTPLKKVGFAAEDEFPTPEALEAFAKRCARWDYLVTPGPKAEDIITDNYRFEKKVLRTGFPRNDALFARNTSEEAARLKGLYGIPTDKKVVLYAPTWRIQNKFDLELDLTALQDTLGDGWAVALRPHHYSLRGVRWDEIDERVVDLSKGPSIEDCYLMADVLITDYSSVMFDYALLGKPMLFFVYDLDNYRDVLRGFNLDFEAEAPGPILRTSKEVVDAMANLDETKTRYSAAYESFREGYCGYEDGHAGERVFKEVIASNKLSHTSCST